MLDVEYYRLSGDEYTVPWERPTSLGSAYKGGVLVNGCFDLLHTGHLDVFYVAATEAEGLRSSLVVAIDSDRRIAEKKGEGRPIESFMVRFKKISFFLNFLGVPACIVEIDSDLDMLNLVQRMRPAFRVRGEISKNSRFPNLKTLVIPQLGDASTSKLIEKIKGI